ncbi:MAG: HAMP domain-containing histidine kinase [Burkholderiales bacterium]|nr:HAMP domain-containing histidine kinase [Burkholderiales bacterium]
MGTTTTFDQGRFDHGPPGGALLTSPHGTLQGLRLLAFLRVFAPIAQALTLFVVTQLYGVVLPMAPLSAVLAIEALVALATWLRVRRARQVSAFELFLQVHLDILIFAVLLYFTGGAWNPFAPLFALPLVIAASALAPRWVGATAISTMLAYALLRFHNVPLFDAAAETRLYELHEDGMVVNYFFAAALLAFFVSRMRRALQQHERLLADARDTQMRNESVVAIGALAAGYAHELSSPLATMAVVVAELKREHGANVQLQHDLQVLDDQLGASKQIVSSLASAAGRRRAESAGGARLDLFIGSIIERARALHPGASLTVSLDPVSRPPRIVAEETLRQAITNLIDNAIEASPHQVQVRADWSGPELYVVVRDRGPGVSAELLQRLGREVATSKAPKGGLGLGLLLSVVTLERLGGSIYLTNRLGGGARAELRLPLSAITIEVPRSQDDGSPSL